MKIIVEHFQEDVRAHLNAEYLLLNGEIVFGLSPSRLRLLLKMYNRSKRRWENLVSDASLEELAVGVGFTVEMARPRRIGTGWGEPIRVITELRKVPRFDIFDGETRKKVAADLIPCEAAYTFDVSASAFLFLVANDGYFRAANFEAVPSGSRPLTI